MLARVAAFAIDGLQPHRVIVEVDVRPGLPGFTIVGLADAAVRESRERVHAALLNSGFDFPGMRITVNLAPAHLRKHGPGFDLATACGILAATDQVPREALEQWAIFGELSLGGEVRSCRGVLAVAEGARREGLEGLVVPRACTREAALVDGLRVAGVMTLREVSELLDGADPPCLPPAPEEPEPDPHLHLDLADVRGHGGPIRALTVAAAGGHNLLMCGPPGTGKTMLARRLPTILPPMTHEEALEITRILSVAGQHASDRGLVRTRPFRAPHHTISAPGLVGGGNVPTPGEASLAHHGVLFLDELSEFPRSTLEALRQPLEDGRVAVVRGQRTALFPTRFMLVASTNPCPCGHAGTGRCQCTEGDIARYRRRLSGPLLDRIDLQVGVHRPSAAELAAGGLARSADVRAEVERARRIQLVRLEGTGATCNAHLTPKLLREQMNLLPAARQTLRRSYEQGTLSPRGHDRLLRVSRTIADLAGTDEVHDEHVVEAIGYRQDADGSLKAVA